MQAMVRTVILPDGRKAVEFEHLHVGGSETQATYEYRISLEGMDIDTKSFKRCSWSGRVEDCEYDPTG